MRFITPIRVLIAALALTVAGTSVAANIAGAAPERYPSVDEPGFCEGHGQRARAVRTGVSEWSYSGAGLNRLASFEVSTQGPADVAAANTRVGVNGNYGITRARFRTSNAPELVEDYFLSPDQATSAIRFINPGADTITDVLLCVKPF